jgi:glycerate kinase
VRASDTAFLDLATASGLGRLAAGEYDPWLASTAGTGQLMRHALEHGAERIVLGVGGSATVDGALGLLSELGVKLRTRSGDALPPGASGLELLDQVDVAPALERLRSAELVVLSDVESPLVGPEGAARVFGPQKGADPEMVERLEAGLVHLAAVLERVTGRRVDRLPRAGAAGGVPASLGALLGARVETGADWVLDAVRFDDALVAADWVVTAEGHLDRQTLGNKAPMGVARRARARGVPVVALCGGTDDDPGVLEAFDVVLSICRGPVPVPRALELAGTWMQIAAEQLGRLLRLSA